MKYIIFNIIGAICVSIYCWALLGLYGISIGSHDMTSESVRAVLKMFFN